MSNIESGQSPSTKASLCYHGRPVVHRTSRRPHSYGRSFSCCPIHWEDPNYCRFFCWDDPPRDEPRAQAPVKQEYMSAPRASASPCAKGLATFSTEDVLPLSPNVRKRDSDDPSREYKRPGSPPLKKPATVQSKFRPARPVMSEEVIEDILDALPAISIHVRELKRQIAMLQESNETMESRILQLEKQLWKKREVASV